MSNLILGVLLLSLFLVTFNLLTYAVTLLLVSILSLLWRRLFRLFGWEPTAIKSRYQSTKGQIRVTVENIRRVNERMIAKNRITVKEYEVSYRQPYGYYDLKYLDCMVEVFIFA
jgi:hypothetical protein